MNSIFKFEPKEIRKRSLDTNLGMNLESNLGINLESNLDRE